MRLVLQRVAWARVEVGDERIAAIGAGLLALVGVEGGDGERQVRAAADKMVALRVFEDERGRFDRDLGAIGGEVLLVPQFTLLASTARGRRPSFERAAAPEVAAPMVDLLAGHLRDAGIPVQRGRFGAHMQVSLLNDGPVTLVIDFPPDE